jgi:hypothetical protein
MTKDEFLRKMATEKPDMGGEYGIIVDGKEIISGGPDYYSCKYKNAKWQIDIPVERGGEDKIFETKSENEVFDYLYYSIQRDVRLYNKRVLRSQQEKNNSKK